MAWQTLGRRLFDTMRNDVQKPQVIDTVCAARIAAVAITCNYSERPESVPEDAC